MGWIQVRVRAMAMSTATDTDNVTYRYGYQSPYMDICVHRFMYVWVCGYVGMWVACSDGYV